MSYLDNKGVERLWAHITAKLGDKVTKEEGKGLSSNDFTTAEKTKLANLMAPSITSTGAGNAVTNISVSGSTFTVEKNADFLTEHPYITKYADTSSTASPAHGDTFTAVDSISRDENGHVEKINIKTVTLPEYTLAGLMGSTAKGSSTLPVYWTGSAWAAITSYSGKASTAGTADKVANALSINGKTYDGSAAIDVGVIDAAHGGTGQTSLLNSVNALINALDNGTSTPVDADYFITGGATYHRRPMSALYAYMKGKMDSVYQAKGTVPMASSTALGGVKVGSGLTIAADGTLNHSNSITAKTAYGSAATTASADGGTITLTDVQYDAQGHITGSTDRTITLSQRTTTLEELGIDTFDKLNTKYGLDDKYKIAPDWIESNSANKNYIKNRPGGYFDTSVVATTGDLTAQFEGVEVTSEQPYELDYVPYSFGNEGNNQNQSLTSIVVGQSYTVVWNGTTYSNVIAIEYYGNVYLGEIESNDSGTHPSFSNYPFLIGISPSHWTLTIATPSSTSARSTTFSISGYNPVQIPAHFLDLSILKNEYVSRENGRANNLQLKGNSYIDPYNEGYQPFIYFRNWLDNPSGWTTSSGLTSIGSITFDAPYGGDVANPNEGNGFFLKSYCYEQDTVNKEWVEAGYIGLGLRFQTENLSNALYLQYRNKNNEVSTYNILTEASTIPITSGGTGATTAAGALTALGAAAATHTQSASTIVSGMFPSWVKANTNAMKALSTAQLRNITISTTDLVEGESTLAEGEIYLVYDGGEA
mgnify:CR=1 FL=1